MSEESTRRVVAQRAILDELAAMHELAKQAEVDELGYGGKRIVTDGGVEIGRAVVPEKKPTVTVVDEAQFLAYIADNHKSEIGVVWQPKVSWQDVARTLHEFDLALSAEALIEVPEVNPSFRKKLLDQVAKGLDVPGVVRSQPRLSVTVTPKEPARIAARQLLAGVFPAIESGGAE